jgi:hypothetical protein
MELKLVLSNGQKHNVKIGDINEFLMRFTDEDGKINRDILFIGEGLYINTNYIIEMTVEEDKVEKFINSELGTAPLTPEMVKKIQENIKKIDLNNIKLPHVELPKINIQVPKINIPKKSDNE